MPQISVIVPVYKVEKYLSRCVDSILAQTFTDYEIILIDDGSPDHCGEMVDEYARKDERIIALHQENQGLSAARNSGIDIAKGDYYTFVDSDDYIYPEYLSKLLNAVIRNDADISICGNIRFSEEPNQKIICNFEEERVVSGRDACKLMYDVPRKSANYVVAWGKLYRKKMFLNHRYPVGKMHEDQFVTYKLMYNAEKVVELGECLYGYYVNRNGIMNSLFKLKMYDGVVAFEETEKFFAEKKEHELVAKVKKEKDFLLALHSIAARKARMYSLVPSEYKINFFKARRMLKENGGIDRYEYFMYSYYPRLIIFEARLRKLKKIITRKDN